MTVMQKEWRCEIIELYEKVFVFCSAVSAYGGIMSTRRPQPSRLLNHHPPHAFFIHKLHFMFQMMRGVDCTAVLTEVEIRRWRLLLT